MQIQTVRIILFVWIGILLLVSVLGYSIERLPSIEIAEDDDDGPELDPRLIELGCKYLCFPITEPTKIIYTLYTRTNPIIGQVIDPFNSDSIISSNYNTKHPTRFIAHGWNSGPKKEINILVTAAFLYKGDFNVIFVDWTSCAQTINYFHARCCVEDVGKQIAQFIDILTDKFQLKLNQLTVIGHSLGAHCMGLAGKNIRNGQINTIIGLDPAKPCFYGNQTDNRLTSTDAEYVETIHTNAGYLSFLLPVGQASFYPNGGRLQSGCNPLKPNLCAHGRSVLYYAESIVLDNFVAVKCTNFWELLQNRCQIINNNNDEIRMGGEPSNYGKAKGIYYLETNKIEPFGIGKL